MIRPLVIFGIVILFLTGQVVSGRSKSDSSQARAASETEIRSGESILLKGELIYLRSCAKCHAQGVSGAPKLGDRETWEVYIGGGIDNMIRHSIEGSQGNKGVMPPRGGDRSLSDAEVEAAVLYMIEHCR